MNNTELPPESVASITDEPAERRKRIRRLVILILLISVGIHVIGGIGAGVWVIARYFTQPKAQFVVQKQVQMAPQDREHRMKMEEVTSLRPKPVFNNRIQSLRPSKLALPELPRVPLETITPINTDALISDQVDGMGQHGEGSGGGGFFGGKGVAGSGLLAGTLYDLKADKSGNRVKMDRGRYYETVGRVARSSNLAALDGYYRASKILYMPQLAIPVIRAESAPKEFGVADKVKPAYWVAVYHGRMTAPESGTFKFLGFADDILLVKINGRLVFDGSLNSVSRLYKKEGVSFTVEKGNAYNIEIIVGECPGGYFSAWLQIQKQGDGSEPYWFRMHDKSVSYKKGGGDGSQRMPQSNKNGPIWRPASKATDSLTGTGL